LLDVGDPAGHRALREATAGYLGAARGVRCDWRQVLIVSSTQQALDLVARVVLDPGDEAWLEEPGYLGARAALTMAGARIVPVPVDAEGIVVEQGVALAPRARLAYVTPSHQYPLGVTATLARRMALLAWADRAAAWIVEDDYDSEFRYAGRPLASVQGLDRWGRVLYAGTFNKVMFPALRIGYLVVPPDLIEPMTAARAATDGPTATLAQAALADFIDDGHFGAHIRQMRRLYEERRDVLRRELDERMGDVLTVSHADTGLHLTAFLSRGRDDRPLAAAAAAAGLDVPPLSRYYIGRAGRRGLVLNFGGAGPAEIAAGVRALAGAARKVELSPRS
jgi:GntR family transcriptional regulator/MocR family aminotransferase